MSLPVPKPDILHFQDLVDEAKRRLIRYCPEWTEYNVSDPGVTLIELFAWMTELITYRLNRVPDTNYVKFMELLGINLLPARSAQVPLTFFLSAPFPIDTNDPDYDINAIVEEGAEVATPDTDEEEEVIFTVDKTLHLTAPRLKWVRREGEVNRDYLRAVSQENIPFKTFQDSPREGDAFYLGFDEACWPLNGRILRLTFTCDETQGVGIDRKDPPLIWEYSMGNDEWAEVKPSTRTKAEEDTTGGFNNATGSLVLYLPLAMKPNNVHDINTYWIRCRVHRRNEKQTMYNESPIIKTLAVQLLGGSVWATQAVVVAEELLGRSSGEPNQTFTLRHTPILALRPEEGETVQVEESGPNGRVVFKDWQYVEEFSSSSRYDRHFTLDTTSGEVQFGPAITQSDGSVRQYGRVPEVDRRVRITRYRYGGGSRGNVPPGSIRILKTAIPYINRVTNLEPASGGRDAEKLEEAKMRTRRELSAQRRAVTVEDYENLAKQSSESVARVKCLAPGKGSYQLSNNKVLPPGMIELLVVPNVAEALQAGDLSQLALNEALQRDLYTYLDRYRLLTTTLHIRPPRYYGVKVHAEIVPETRRVDHDLLLSKVVEHLNDFLTPLPMVNSTETLSPFPHTQGWPFGRDLYVAAIYAQIQQIPGVRYVTEVKLSYRVVEPENESPPEQKEEEAQPTGDDAAQPPDVKELLIPVNTKMLIVPDDTLLCSLQHEVKIDSSVFQSESSAGML